MACAARETLRPPYNANTRTVVSTLPIADPHDNSPHQKTIRGGANGGYNYDDDYYGGPGGGEDPYYEDAGGWGDDGGGAGRGRDGGRYDPFDDGRAPTKGRSGSNVAGFDLTGTITNGNKSGCFRS